jgi:hypothetical protein
MLINNEGITVRLNTHGNRPDYILNAVNVDVIVHNDEKLDPATFVGCPDCLHHLLCKMSIRFLPDLDHSNVRVATTPEHMKVLYFWNHLAGLA